MFSAEMRSLFFQVITSWQVIAVTVAVLLYVGLINRVSSARSRKKIPPPPVVVERPRSRKGESEEQIDDSGLGLDE